MSKRNTPSASKAKGSASAPRKPPSSKSKGAISYLEVVVDWRVDQVKELFDAQVGEGEKRERVSAAFGKTWFLKLLDTFIVRATVYPASPPSQSEVSDDDEPCALEAIRAACFALFEHPGASNVCFLVKRARSTGPVDRLLANKRILGSRLAYCQNHPEATALEPRDSSPLSDLANSPPAKRPKLEEEEPKATSSMPVWDDDATDWLPREYIEKYELSTENELFDDGTQSGNDGKRRQEIEVDDASYLTSRAVLYFLHTNEISFTPIASNFLVSLANGTTGCLSRRDFLCLSRRMWVRTSSRQVRMLCIDSLRAPFEFFAEHQEIKTVALNFALKHWQAVTATIAFDRVLEDSALDSSPGASETWKGILKSLMKAG
ncbi:hypothetical protein JCM8547_008751 [Rhodosporidiobolus lusitaniae]